MLWKKAIPAKQRIKEIEQGLRRLSYASIFEALWIQAELKKIDKRR
jgi:hypothetical protein